MLDKPDDLKVKKMALEEISRLYNELVDTEFHVMPAGQFHIEDIYTKVKSNFSSLCDDFPCVRFKPPPSGGQSASPLSYARVNFG